jgi:hypothetical protein
VRRRPFNLLAGVVVRYTCTERFGGVILASVLCAGCSAIEGGIRRGTPITHVQAEYGLPEVVADESGDLKRFYVPTHRPAYEWPADAPRTLYCLDRGLAVTFVSGKVVRVEQIDAELRDGFLIPLVRRHRGTQ